MRHSAYMFVGLLSAAWPLVALAAQAVETPSPPSPDAAEAVEVRTVPLRSPLLWVSSKRPVAEDRPLVLAVFAGSRPVGIADRVADGPGPGVFMPRVWEPAASATGVLRAWVFDARPSAADIERWPRDAEYFAEIDSVGPGERTAWITAGRRAGVRVGDCWWLRIEGQPAARFDVLWVDEELTFVEVVALLADLQLHPQQRVARWPTPGQRRDGVTETAVSFVTRTGGAREVWAPAPRGVPVPDEPHVTFWRRGQVVGHGVVQRYDERFWYTSFVPTLPGAEPLVADRMVVRTLRDIIERRFAARVFELSPAGAVIDAGETDRVNFGDVGTVWRGGRVVGQVTVTQAQRAYSVVAPAPIGVPPPGPGEAGTSETQPSARIEPRAGPDQSSTIELRIGDEIRFWTPPPAPVRVGVIAAVLDDLLFAARFEREPPSDGLAIVDGRGVTIGVAVLFQRDGAEALGYVPPASRSAPLAAGHAIMVLPPIAPPAESP